MRQTHSKKATKEAEEGLMEEREALFEQVLDLRLKTTQTNGETESD